MNFLASKIDLMGDILNSENVDLKESKSTKELADKIEDIFKRMGFKKS